jgi:hypothetical protein
VSEKSSALLSRLFSDRNFVGQTLDHMRNPTVFGRLEYRPSRQFDSGEDLYAQDARAIKVRLEGDFTDPSNMGRCPKSR